MLWTLWDELSEDEFHERILQQALEDKEYLHILGTREWKIPIHTYHVGLTASTKTKIDILKKMIMHTILNMKINDLEQLSRMLHVDSLFIKDIIFQMLQTGVVENKNGIMRLTNIGEEQLKAGTILSEPVNESVQFEFSPYNKNALLDEPTNVLVKEEWEEEFYRYSPEEYSLEGEKLDEVILRQFVKDSGKVFEVGGNEKIISKIDPVQLTDTRYAKCIEFQLYDMLENNVYTRVWNGASSRWDERFEEEINQYESEVLKSQYDEAITEHFPERYEYLRKQLKEFNNKSHKKNEKQVDILRGKDIRNKFIHSFADTKRKMLMVSPWISSQVVDNDMISKLQQFAKQNKSLYISWGIAKDIRDENRQPSEQLLKKLNSIMHDDGTKAVFVRWFGNQHNKEIVIDNKTHLLGSYNWLSYRGDYDIRHESVVIVNDKKIINETTEYIETKFIQALEKELEGFMDSTHADPIELKNWMKELIMLDSLLDKRKSLSERLMHFLKENQQEELIHEMASMWVRYDCEDFGTRYYLRDLLLKEDFDRAKAYYSLSLKHIQTTNLWEKSAELKEFNEWLKEHAPSNQPKIKVDTKAPNKKPDTKNKKTKKKKK